MSSIWRCTRGRSLWLVMSMRRQQRPSVIAAEPLEKFPIYNWLIDCHIVISLGLHFLPELCRIFCRKLREHGRHHRLSEVLLIARHRSRSQKDRLIQFVAVLVITQNSPVNN